jgi:hypothetical protein
MRNEARGVYERNSNRLMTQGELETVINNHIKTLQEALLIYEGMKHELDKIEFTNEIIGSTMVIEGMVNVFRSERN